MPEAARETAERTVTCGRSFSTLIIGSSARIGVSRQNFSFVRNLGAAAVFYQLEGSAGVGRFGRLKRRENGMTGCAVVCFPLAVGFLLAHIRRRMFRIDFVVGYCKKGWDCLDSAVRGQRPPLSRTVFLPSKHCRRFVWYSPFVFVSSRGLHFRKEFRQR